MAKFDFKFETIKRIKDKLKSKAQKELAEINLKIDQKKVKIDEARRELYETKQMLRKDGGKVSELHYYERHGIYLNGKITKMIADIEKLEIEKQKRLDELVVKTQESKMFELLKDKHLQVYNEEELKKDNAFLDELAIQKSGRK